MRIRKNDYIRDNRYKIIKTAGKGTFGTVLEVYDFKHRENIALKVVRSVPRYLDAAYVEVEILEKIRRADRKQKSLCVRLLGAFTTRIKNQKHVCIAFEKLGMSIYEFIRSNRYRGFKIDQVAKIGFQTVHSIAFCHSIKLTHTDLKPENILLCDDKYDKITDDVHGRDYKKCRDVSIRVIDFGGATFAEDHHSQMINTRQYRAPEVILGLGWDEKSDIWSIGCILAELYTGELLFGTHEDIEHLALMEKILGVLIPEGMIDNALKKFAASGKKRKPSSRRKNRGRSPSAATLDCIFSEETLKLRWPEHASSQKSSDMVQNTQTLEELIPNADLADCIRQCLVYESKDRISAEDLREHPLFRDHFHPFPNFS